MATDSPWSSGAKNYRMKKEGGGGGGETGETGDGVRKPFPFVSFLPLPHPLFLILALVPISRGQNTVPWPFFAPQPHGNACYAGYATG